MIRTLTLNITVELVYDCREVNPFDIAETTVGSIRKSLPIFNDIGGVKIVNADIISSSDKYSPELEHLFKT